MARRTLNIPGRGPMEADEVGFRTLGEHWNEYLLDDGTTVRVKLVVTAAYRLEGEYDAEGNPAYIVSSTNVVKADSPDELRKDGGQ